MINNQSCFESRRELNQLGVASEPGNVPSGQLLVFLDLFPLDGLDGKLSDEISLK